MTAVQDAPSAELIISADDHVIEPPDLWQSRLPAHLRDRGPRVVPHPSDGARMERGVWHLEPGGVGPAAAFWHYEDLVKPLCSNEAAAGLAEDEVETTPIGFDGIRPGCWQPAARLADMDVNGIAASLCFPNYPRFAGQMFSESHDLELGLACIRAYNDWMVEEWCAGSRGRLIPLCIVPLWDAELAAAEVRRNASRGVRAVAFTELPAWLGAPSIHTGFWDPFFTACSDTGTVVSIHIGSGSRVVRSSDDAPRSVAGVTIFANSAMSMLDYLCGGVLERFEDLRLLYAESQIGWIPYVLERADDMFAHQRFTFPTAVTKRPSEIYRGRVFSCFFSDQVGVDLIDRIGEDQVLFETDYPHASGTWPRTADVVAKELGGLDPSVRRKVLAENAIRLFGLSF
jgi:predicted TIM-barrel fold metal-dependent hydrolase